jgi:hypothetical protein
MHFSLFSALDLAPLTLAFGSGCYGSPEHAVIARDFSNLKADLYALERRFAEASYEDEDVSFGGLSARSAFDEDEYLDMILRRALSGTLTEGQRTHRPQHFEGNLGRVNKKLGQFRKGTEGKTTEDKRKEIDRLASNRERGRINTDRYYR